MCPFCKHHTFAVHAERRTFKCNHCGKSGDAFGWIMQTEDVTFEQAVELLASDQSDSPAAPASEAMAE